ncbi:MAG: cation:proton antiporter [Candidatus Cyclonatronum sp.]|uniref:cation:proton antiporter domain-containing protein n=1 Tax=Cyclonatronum sp. TaxID=3024185 RepID=UPI0025C0C9BC|nr:cation:proton antiporter [Cyclonatronum sp.]MCH8485377.1 cation:proton antiporter [Cyclonatronum sp.]
MDSFFQLNLPVNDPVLIFAIVMLIILLAPMVVQRLKIPGLVGTILAGTIVGPSVLGLLERDQTIILLGTVGLLYLMFMAGLSIDLNKFEKNRNKSLIFGLISFLIPQLAALPVGMYLLDFSLASSLLLGSIVGSHTLLAYPIANRIGITKNTGVTMAMGGTIVTDMLSLLILAIVANSLADATGFTFWLTFAVLVIGYTAAILLGLPVIGRWFFKNVRNQTNTEYVFMIALLFISAFLADLVGLAPIIGAFLAGLTLNRLVPESGTLMSRVQFVGNAYFIPFFLISVGMLVDVKVMFESWEVWAQTAAFTALVLFGKGFAAKLTQWIFKLTPEEGWTIAGLTIPQAAATLAVTLVGFEIGLFTQTSVNAVVLMILITCLIGPSLVERYGRKVALKEASQSYNPLDAPERILVPLANPQTAEALMDIAMIIRKKNSTEPLFPLTVARSSDTADSDARVAESEKMLSHSVVHAAAAEVPVLPVTRIDMNISNGIIRAVKELRISHVVIGWNGEISARQRIFGTVLDQLLEQSKQLIMVSKIDHPLNITERIFLIVPPYLDREPGFTGAMLTIKNMVNEIGAELLVVTSRNNHQTLKQLVENQEPEIEAGYIVLDEWASLLKDERIQFKDEEDLLILLSTRNGTVSWDANLERLPRIIAQNYPGVNFFTIYPSEITNDDSQQSYVSFDNMHDIPDIHNENVNFELDDMDAHQALRELMGKRFNSNPVELSEIIEKVLAQEIDNLPGELPGVVLTKTRSVNLQEPALFMGISPNGISYPNVEEKVKLLFVLVSPASHSTQRNIRTLGNIARMLGHKKTYLKLKDARTFTQISKIIFDARSEF